MTVVPLEAPTGTEPVLQADIVVRRGEFELVTELKAGDGEVVGVLGPNGAGKTTLLRTLAGLDALASGEIVLAGTVLDSPASGIFIGPDKRAVGLVFQNYRLFPHLSALDNVAFGLRSTGTSRRAAHAVAADWLERFGLADCSRHKPAELSGGQAQRVALARSLAAEPNLLLLDEPLAALDARTRLSVRTELRKHLAEFGGPTLLVTHDPLEAMVMTDRLLVLERGRLVQHGRPADIARRPSTQYVARLMGLNLLAGERQADSISLDGGGSLVAGIDAQLTPVGSRVLVSIRPSAITLHTARPDHSSSRNVWAGRITGLELLTDRVRVQVTGEPDALVDITPSAAAELELSEGTPVWLSAKATEVEAYPDPR